MKRIGLLCLAVVLALGTLGVGYAAWYQTVEIEQTVQTGTLEVGVRGFYDFYQLKEVMDVEVTHGDRKFDKEVTHVPAAALFEPGTYDFHESVKIALNNFYPSIWVREDFVIGVGGTVPVKLQVTGTYLDPDGVYANMSVAWKIWLVRDGVVSELNPGNWGHPEKFPVMWPNLIAALQGQQLYGCDVVIIFLDKYLQQCTPQGKDAEFTLKVTGVQYNKYPYTIP